MKISSPISKSKQLFPVLFEYFQGKINLAHITFIATLCKAQTVNFQQLAINFEGKASVASCLRRIQRFMATCVFPQELIIKLILALLPEKTSLKLMLDRTNWKFGTQNISIFMVGVASNGIAIPLMFTLLNKKEILIWKYVSI